ASVLALYSLQKSMMATPWGPRAVPTGGAGVAPPAGIWILTIAATFFLPMAVPSRFVRRPARSRTATDKSAGFPGTRTTPGDHAPRPDPGEREVSPPRPGSRRLPPRIARHRAPGRPGRTGRPPRGTAGGRRRRRPRPGRSQL